MTTNGHSANGLETTPSQVGTPLEHRPKMNGTMDDTSNGATQSHAGGTGEHLTWVVQHTDRLNSLVGSASGDVAGAVVAVNGQDLSLAELVAVSSHRVKVHVSDDEAVRARVNASVDFLKRHMDSGEVVYGINTGFGGSADARSGDFASMQRALIQHQNSGVLLPSDIGRQDATESDNLASLKSHSLPRHVVRGSMLTRINSLMRGHSGVRLLVIEAIAELLNRDFIPVIPLRGSISASGDLQPLSYIAGALEGNHDIYLDCRMADGARQVLGADKALRLAGLEPIVMQPKEGLGLMNGTAVSCAAACLALHEAQQLAALAQTLTAMCTEALRGSADNYHSFISNVRPHAGQKEVAQNISKQLKDSKLVVGKDAHTAGLFQDRYALRTASQWLGPQLEDLQLAARQLEVELNSTTDNPLIDAENGLVHHGGNFQAASVTSAMEKTRLALQMIGKLMFSQTSELINPMLNSILTPNLCFDDSDVSFTFKGVDINMAAYMSELAFLANPVSSHVQSAEMHNQAVNSLALISARYTLDAVDVASIMASAYLYSVLQGLDLHVLFLEYTAVIEREAHKAFQLTFGDAMSSTAMELAWSGMPATIRAGLISTKSKGLTERARETAEATIVPVTKALLQEPGSRDALSKVGSWVDQLAHVIQASIESTRTSFASSGAGNGATTLQYLGHGSAVMYKHIRGELGLPVHKGLVEHPTFPKDARDGVSVAKEDRSTIGSRISKIYVSLRSGEMRNVVVKSLT